MADSSDSGVLTRGLESLRDAVTGSSNEQATDEQSRDETTQSGTETDDSDLLQSESTASVQERAEAYADVMAECADGDLTTRMEPEGDDEPIDRIAVEFNDMVSDLETTTGQLQSYVEEVESAGVGIEQSADTVRRASEDVVDSMQNISADTEAQREQLETVAETLDEVAATLEQFTTSHPDAGIAPQIRRLQEQASEIRDVAETNEEIQTETTIVSAAVEEQAAELSEVSSRAADLQRYAKPLSGILDGYDTETEHH